MSRELKARLDDGRQTLADDVKLALAEYAAGVFPNFSVYTQPQQQNVSPPAVFVDIFSTNYGRLLARTVQYEFGFYISYWPANPLSSAEADETIMRLTSGITLLPSFPVQGVQGVESDTTDGAVSITGSIRVRGAVSEEHPLIASAAQNLTQKEE